MPATSLTSSRRTSRHTCRGHRRRHRPEGWAIFDADWLRGHRRLASILSIGIPTSSISASRSSTPASCRLAHERSDRSLWRSLNTGEHRQLFGHMDNNGAVAGMGGIGLNLLGGNLMCWALAFRPGERDTPSVTALGANCYGFWRFENDIRVDMEGHRQADVHHRRQHDPRRLLSRFRLRRGSICVLRTDRNSITLNARAEVWRDQNNFFVAGYPGILTS